MKKWINSLIFKIGAVVIITDSIVLALIGYVYIHQFSMAIDSRMHRQVQLPGQLMNRQLLRYASVSDTSVMNALLGEEFVDGIITDKDGKVYYALNADDIGRNIRNVAAFAKVTINSEMQFPGLVPYHENGAAYLISVTPLFAYEGAAPFFFACIKVKAAVSEAAKNDVLRLFIIGSLICLALTSIAIIWFVRAIVTHPIGRLKESVNQVAQGNLAPSIRLPRRDELGILSDSFEKMRTAIREQIDKLATFNRNLEKTVSDRTRELHDHMQRLEAEIGERRQVEAELRESKDLFSSFMDNLPAMAFMKNRKGVYLFLNNAYKTFLSADPEMRLGKTDEELWPATVAEKIRKNDQWVMETGRVLMTTEIVSHEGREYHHFVTKFPVYKDKDGPVLGGIALDLTERVKAENEKIELMGQLQRAQKMEAIGTLAGGVAHDLNNILSGIISYPELLLMELPPESPLRKPIQTIQKSGEKAAAIVQDLLTLARRGVTTTETLQLNDIIRDYLESPEFERLSEYHDDIRVTVNLSSDLMHITGSGVHLSKTIMNLVSNAAEAIDGPGAVRIETENRYVDYRLKGYDTINEGEYALLSVHDTGSGISADDLERIFEPFYTKKKMGRSGTGLGLAVVWGVVKDHGGYIEIENRIPCGTTFRLYFPISRDERQESAAPETDDIRMGNNESVLVVDDVAEQREIAVLSLQKLGYDVRAVESGEAAVHYLKDRKVDLLLLDMIMTPGMDGLETFLQIKACHPEQKAVIASGYSETDRVRRALAAGAGAYLRKPYLLKKLSQVVRDVLDNNRTADKISRSVMKNEAGK